MQVIEIPDTTPSGQAVMSPLRSDDVNAVEFAPRGAVVDDAQVLAVVSPLESGGGGLVGSLPFSTRTVIADTIGVPGELLKVDASAGEVTVSPPSTPAAGTYLTVMKVDTSVHAAIWSGEVNGDAEGAELLSANAAATFVYDGTGWLVESVNTAFNVGGGSGGQLVDATTLNKGIVQLAGDLAGTADAPTVPGLTGKASTTALTAHTSDTSNPHATTKAQVGLGNADNTADTAKPVSTAQQTALNGKVSTDRVVSAGAGLIGGGDLTADRSLSVIYGTASSTAAQGNDSRLSDARAWTLYGGGSPTSGQVPSWNGTAYVPTTVAGGGALPDASSTVKGIVQLTGDLGGTATAPTVPGLASKAPALVATTIFTTGSHTPASGEFARYSPSSNITVTLPAAAAGQRFGVANLTSGASTVTLNCTGSDTFSDGSTSAILTPGSRLVLLGASGGFSAESRTPNLATVATSGSYTDLTNQPVTGVSSVNSRTGAVTGLAEAASVVPTTRQVTAGTGLTGGGDLSADRALAVSFGTTSGTVAQGNDSRITGAAPTASPTFTGTVTAARVVASPVTVTYAATTTIDASLGNHFRITLTGNVTLAIPTNPIDGQHIIIELIQDATGGRTLTLATTGTGCFNVTTAITGAIALTTAAGTRSYLGATYRTAGAKWDVLAFATGIAV